jgi:uncharacterized membrane protein (DUF2068 family)
MPNKVKSARLCLIVAGALKIATAGLFLFIMLAGSVFVRGSGERSGLLGNALLGSLGVVLLLASAAAGAFDLIAASGVRRRTAWGRALGVIAGALLVPLFPVGTVLGLFALSGLLGADGREWFTAAPVNL